VMLVAESNVAFIIRAVHVYVAQSDSNVSFDFITRSVYSVHTAGVKASPKYRISDSVFGAGLDPGIITDKVWMSARRGMMSVILFLTSRFFQPEALGHMANLTREIWVWSETPRKQENGR